LVKAEVDRFQPVFLNKSRQHAYTAIKRVYSILVQYGFMNFIKK